VDFQTAEPMTARGPRKGESSQRSMRNGLRPQPARLVRGSSRRIMAMRFRPANIRVINRRVCSWAVIGPAVPQGQRGTKPTVSFPFGIPILPSTQLQAHQQERVPATPPVADPLGARTVLAVKGSLRRAKNRRALDCCAPFRPDGNCDGRLRREHFSRAAPRKKRRLPYREAGVIQRNSVRLSPSLTGSLHIRTSILSLSACGAAYCLATSRDRKWST
jgi:hypothetical protein